MESMVDFTGGMPPEELESESPTADADNLLNLLGIQVTLSRLDILRSVGGQRGTPVLELLRAKDRAATQNSTPVAAASCAPQHSLVAQLLSLTPAQADPTAVRLSFSLYLRAELTHGCIISSLAQRRKTWHGALLPLFPTRQSILLRRPHLHCRPHPRPARAESSTPPPSTRTAAAPSTPRRSTRPSPNPI